ncbi:hypothetical protein [Cellulomonas sp. C5510]|uniref:hypothetical protein n=1 Tax=Cellulomonas sp. C5510 TaxID=2871170 RepID=UPI001C98A057|nr:hypothetical protein [Cellulomonas sp. C5510]QZN84781.1 hypothetical protein K5O09_13250 [Cellulomonas sp. C5510]
MVAVGATRSSAVRLPFDLSYGTYLYAWPAAQVTVALGAASGWRPSSWALFAVTLAPTLLLAAALWFGVERPMLRLRGSQVLRTGPHAPPPG